MVPGEKVLRPRCIYSDPTVPPRNRLPQLPNYLLSPHLVVLVPLALFSEPRTLPFICGQCFFSPIHSSSTSNSPSPLISFAGSAASCPRVGGSAPRVVAGTRRRTMVTKSAVLGTDGLHSPLLSLAGISSDRPWFFRSSDGS